VTENRLTALLTALVSTTTTLLAAVAALATVCSSNVSQISC